MIRHKFLILSLFLSVALLGFGCAKKAGPASAADGASSSSGLDAQDLGADGGALGTRGDLPIIYFDFDSSSLNDQGRNQVQDVAKGLGSDSSKITIEGHCDERGSNEYNLALGDRRARAVKEYLERLGVASSRISVISYGEERPAQMGSSESAWAKNRRAELVINR